MARTWMAAAVVAAVSIVGCSSTQTRLTGVTDPGPSTEVSTTTTVEETTTTVEETTTTVEESTTTTEESTTTTAPPPVWTPIDPAAVGMPIGSPCCGENWTGVAPSPALPMPGVPLSDGIYWVSGDWPLDPTSPAVLTVRRFESCDLVVDWPCETPAAPGDMGVDATQEYSLELPLNASLQVVVAGFETNDAGDVGVPVVVGDGVLFGEFLEGIVQAFETNVAVRLRGGEDWHDVYHDVATHPVDGFGAAAADWNTLVYTAAPVPTIMFQDLYGNGAQALHPIALRVQGGVLTITVYGGYYP